VSKHSSGRTFLIADSVANFIRLGSLIAIALGLFAVISGGVAIYLNLDSQLALERADRAAEQQADRFATELARIQTALRDASVVDAARSGSSDRMRRALRDRDVVSILDARVLPASVDEVALGADTGLDFAATEMVLEAIRNERAEIRVLQPGTPGESLAFAQRLPGDSGVLLLRLTVNVLTTLLEEHELLDFMALAQRTGDGFAVLDAAGRSAAARIRTQPVAGSGLVLQWNRAVVAAPVGNRTAVIMACSGVIVLMFGLLLRRRTRLAQYLEPRQRANKPVASRRPEPGAAWARPAPDENPPTEATMVLGEAEEDDARAAEAPRQTRRRKPAPPGNRSSDLPEWLQSAEGFDLDELDADDATLETTHPGAADEAAQADDALLEDIEDSQGVDPALFADDGIHGLAGEALDVPAMVILGQAIGSEAGERGLRRLCVAHDGRESGPELLDALVQGLTVSGIDVVDLGATPAPVAWFAGMRRQQAGAVLVTGGERPEEVNGLEIVFDGQWLDREARERLLERIRQQDFASGAGDRSAEDESRAYAEQLGAEMRLAEPLRVVLDCGSPVVGSLAPKLFEALDVDVIPLNADTETDAGEIAAFSGAQREQDLKLCVYNFAADLGLAFDRTAGRLRLVGPEGEPVAMERLAGFLLADLAEQTEDPIVTADADLAAALALQSTPGVEVIACEGDAAAVQRSMRERGAALALHSDGTVCAALNWHGLPDALQAAAWLLSVLAADGSPIKELLHPERVDEEAANGRGDAT
jgi:phosphomannomutase